MKQIDFFRSWQLFGHIGGWILALWLAVAGTAWAQRAMPPAPPTLRLATPGAQLQPSMPVFLESIRIDTEIAGSRAVTAVEMQFRNPNARVLEGELQFPLLDGQEVVGFALDIDGRLRDAVPVEKAKGQAVFEDTIRARIDPALLEKTVGNNFKLRVYPLPPHGTRRVLLRYAETLPVDHGLRVYRLPLDYARKLNSFALRILVQAAEFAPQLAGARPQGLSFDLKGIDYQAQVERKDFSAQGVLEVRLPQSTRPEVVTQTVGDKTYFVAEVPAASETAARSLPAQVGLLWDASGSGAKRDHEREFAVLEAYFKKMGQGVVHLVRFRDTPEAAQRFEIRQGQWTELRRALESTPYDGATYLGGLKPLAGVGEYLLFSDGLQNYGDDRLPRFDAPTFVCAAALQSDPTRLRHIAASSGGRFIDLNALDAHSAAQALLIRQEHVVALGGEGVARLIMASNYAENGRWRIAGELTKDAATLRLNLSGGKAPRILTVPLKREGRVAGFAASAWAALRIAELEAEASTNRAEIRRLGMAFALATRATSLIVLDRIEDYVRHEIDPPAELRADYERLRRDKMADMSRERGQHLDRIAALFKQEQAWWEKSFPKNGRPAVKAAAKVMPRNEADLNTFGRMPEASSASELRDDAPRSTLSKSASRVQSGQSAGNRLSFDGAEHIAPAAPMAMPAPPTSAPVAKGNSMSEPAAASIRLKPWQPDAAYARRLRDAAQADLYRIYLDERPSYVDSTAFHLDVADIFFERAQPELGVRILSNLAEMELENRHILRVLAYRLMQAGRPASAVELFKRVRDLAPEEPQSHRDLGLAHAAAGERQAALHALYDVVERPWAPRFPEIESIALAELNALIASAPAGLDLKRIDPRLIRSMPLDLRVVMTWDADNSDMDLWVTDPDGEMASYSRPLTYQGGRMSRDFTGGYGPETFSLRQAKPGKYRVEANFYGHRQQVVAGATTLQVKLTTGFGTPKAKEEIVTLRLKGAGAKVFVGEFEVK